MPVADGGWKFPTNRSIVVERKDVSENDDGGVSPDGVIAVVTRVPCTGRPLPIRVSDLMDIRCAVRS